MWKLFRGKKGFTLVEVMFVAVIGFVIIASILSVWVFACRTWTGETERTNLRIGMVKALETIKNDLRLSSVPHISYYPAGAEKYTAFSIPVASLDANGFFTLNVSGTIDWDKTVIYHLFPAGGSKYTLRRTVFDPRDNTMTSAQRYTQLANVVSAGDGSSLGGSTDMEFLENVDLFTISSLAPSVDFYDPSSYAVKENQVMFGWVKLGSGSHTIRLEITGKNSLSSGYDLGVDNIRIEPCGSVREVECANSGVFPGVFNVSGGTANNIFGSFWNNNGFVELTGAGVGSYMEITDSYDLWRESAFNGVSFNNTERVEDEFRIGLDVPEDQEQGATAWFVAGAIGDPVQEGTSGFVNPVNPAVAPSQPIVVRTLIDNSHVTIDPDVPGDQVDMIRVNFKTATFGNLKIDKAYITRKSNSATAQSYDGVANDDPTSKTIQEYHCHQQLFFKDTIADFDNDGNTNDIVEGVIISPSAPQKGEAWSEWTAFPLIVREPAGMGAVDYFITFYVSDLTQAACSYWQGGATNSYYLTSPGIGNAAGTPVWGGVYTPAMSNDV
ncbi:MAG: prepilin-type N-terminal cleavage/methylation domain-containing protein, partial [Candidatus Omnitrophota bacterium]